MLHVAEGSVQGYSILDKFGRNPLVSGLADIWPGGDLYTGFPTGAPETITVVSSSVSDSFTGAGAGQIILLGLGPDWEEQQELVNLNGVTPVVTTLTWRRMNRARVLRSANGANTSFNVGTITARYTPTPSVVFMQMPPGLNQTSQAVYTTPAGKALYLDRLVMELDRATTADALGAIYAKTEGSAPWISRVFSVSNARGYYNDFKFSIRYPPKTDISIRVLSISGGNLDILASFQGVQAPF